MSNCKRCGGYNNSLTGDYCLGCIQEAKVSVQSSGDIVVDRHILESAPKVSLEAQAQQIIDKLDKALHTARMCPTQRRDL